MIEPSTIGCINAKDRGVKYIVNGAFENLGLQNSVIPNIGLFDVVEHIKDDKLFLKKLSKTLISEGKIFITVPAYRFLWSDDDVSAGHFRRYTLKNLSQVLEKEGFEIIYRTYFFTILTIPIFLFRSLPSRLRKNKKKIINTSSEHSAGLLTPILKFIFKIEAFMIKKRIIIPFGSSCLLVANKKE